MDFARQAELIEMVAAAVAEDKNGAYCSPAAADGSAAEPVEDAGCSAGFLSDLVLPDDVFFSSFKMEKK